MIAKQSCPKLLVASSQVLDESFDKTVILLTEQDKKGALGFIVNRVTEFDLAGILEDQVPSIPSEVPVWYGGPVECESGYILAIDADKTLENRSNETFHQLSDGIILSTDLSELNKLIDDHEKQLTKELRNYHFRFIVGYAGWGPGQLEEEIRKGFWVELPLDKDLLIGTDPTEMWESAFERLGIPNPSMLTSQPQSNHSWLN